MPMFDGAGPRGQGPMTGRGLGPCGRGYGRGFGRGFGYGRGRGYGYGPRFGYAPSYGYQNRMVTKEEEANMLQDEADELTKELKAIKERIADLKGGK